MLACSVLQINIRIPHSTVVSSTPPPCRQSSLFLDSIEQRLPAVPSVLVVQVAAVKYVRMIWSDSQAFIPWLRLGTEPDYGFLGR